jgi:hypothetical protein
MSASAETVGAATVRPSRKTSVYAVEAAGISRAAPMEGKPMTTRLQEPAETLSGQPQPGQPSGQPTVSACCGPTQQTTCCEPAAKAACCDASHPKGCGCK